MPPTLNISPDTALSDPDVLVRVEGVSKKFCLSLKKSLWYGLQDMGRELTGRRRSSPAKPHLPPSTGSSPSTESPSPCYLKPDTCHRSPSTFHLPPDTTLGLRPKEFWAVQNVSFELKRGECLGLIGRNGAGKTTLLKMLNGLIKPDAGRIEMRGRVGALIALGAGFNPILTGRENIYVNASVLGLSKKETDAKLDEIIDFAEIGDFIDTPVQNYSSGMTVRLGFAIASTLEPDILLLDEVLAVGDADFRAKCYRRISQLRSRAAVIFVSHSMEQIAQVCDRSLVLEKGHTLYWGDVSGAVHTYSTMTFGSSGQHHDGHLSIDKRIQNVQLNCTEKVNYGDSICVQIHFATQYNIGEVKLRVSLWDCRGAVVTDAYTIDENIMIEPGEHTLEYTIAQLALKNGVYRYAIGLLDRNGTQLIWSHQEIVLNVRGPVLGVSPYVAIARLTHSLDAEITND